ncbi:response regulator [Micromonospora sp. WMMD1128]|uniref:response regulator n=1 Tax=Micromonospora sp. WMMD1128 TaxID=3015150 RepID=UPI00248D3038|nr:response regulator [Micromonospora sp. WMMD1128]WBB75391.1 response regulator [Micromonospora sp. WMMD1128]
MADILRAVAMLAWPLLVIVVLVYLLPAARRLLRDSHSVDDEPEANVYERARAVDGGYEVVQATSTEMALKLISGTGPTVIVSDMGRMENGRFNATAGLDLVRDLRRQGDQTPVVFYTSPRGVARYRAESGAIAGVSCTASPTELARILHV